MKTIYKALSLTLSLLMVMGIAMCALAGEPNSADEPMSVSQTNDPTETLSAAPEPNDAPAAQGTSEPAQTLSPEPTPDAMPEPARDSTMMAEPTQSDSPTEASPEPSPTPALAPTASPVPNRDDAEEAQTGQGDGTGLELTPSNPGLDWKGVVPANDGGMPVPRLYQYDYTTVLCQYGGIPRSVNTSGCNVTCVAMVAAYLTGEEHSPEELFSWALENNLYTLSLDGVVAYGVRPASAIARW